ncbi:hypothetical protein ACIBEK_28970 [Nocardia fusca]|uniref:hypothetical protein n=1 Tax=Nocardia fusca TaxID=941183 RepID=UPI00379BB7C6
MTSEKCWHEPASASEASGRNQSRTGEILQAFEPHRQTLHLGSQLQFPSGSGIGPGTIDALRQLYANAGCGSEMIFAKVMRGMTIARQTRAAHRMG